MIFAYARVSTAEQNLDGQIDELKKRGYDELYTEKASGAKSDRPELTALLSKLRQGDTILVYRLDRLGRSIKHLIDLVDQLNKKGVSLVSVSDAIDTSTANGKLIFHVFAAIADFERSLIQERTNIGLKAARARGRVGGRRPGLSEESQKKAILAEQLYRQGESTVSEICERLNIGSRATLYQYVAWVKKNRQPETQLDALQKRRRTV